LSGQLGTLGLTRTTMILGASAALLAYAYSFNDIYDKELEYSRRGSLFLRARIRTKRALFPVIPLLVSLVLLSMFSLHVVILGVSFAILWAMYSYPVPRLKAIPGVCTVVNGVGFPVLFLMGFAVEAPPNLESMLIFCMLVLLEIPAQLIHEVCHASKDRLFQVHTTAVRYGEKGATEAAIASLLGVLSLIVYMLSRRVLSLGVALDISLFASVFIVLLAVSQTRKPVGPGLLRRLYKYAGIIVGSAVAALTILHF
jgi:4-hydroxybenzoate polyprenyltransferase